MTDSKTFAIAGEQIWNADKTQGYEFVLDVNRNEPVYAQSIKPLGEAPAIKEYELIPKWFADIVLVPGGYEEYKLKRNIITKA